MTVPNPTPTYYAACAGNNIIDKAQGSDISSLVTYDDDDNSFSSDFVHVDATSPYDCCAQCQAYAASNDGALCSSSFYLIHSDGNDCILLTGSSCHKAEIFPYQESGCGTTYVSNGCQYISSFSVGSTVGC